MKKLLFLSLIFYACSQGTTQQNPPSESAPPDVPQPDKYEQAYENPYIVPAYAQYETPNGQYLMDKFYPLGWSPDGHFAYMVEPGDEACGCYFFRFVILNLDNDDILWEFDYNDQDFNKGDKGDAPRNFKEIIAEKRTIFDQKLTKHDIAPSVSQQGQFPLGAGGKVLEIKIDAPAKPVSDLGGLFLQKARVEVLVKNEAKGKTIFKKDYTGKYVHALEKGGYLKSPYEDRVAVILLRIRRGWEGLPRVVGHEVVGCLTKDGF